MSECRGAETSFDTVGLPPERIWPETAESDVDARRTDREGLGAPQAATRAEQAAGRV
jgi:hypothetical protein